ncbi:hypothetical protein LSH36_734g02054 [Paralvinella palmiformis]|uniref:Uncharacterized protein n=1 Tax=Paralvinella palmiformis TaxID=53620 RepID=A0AAD9J162_9ANNE|nr:hypothetical protein LSH36_734g02054 [Paralvinella palmiformis]
MVFGAAAQYNFEKVYEPNRVSLQGEFLSPRTQLARLFSRLQNLEKKIIEDSTGSDRSRSSYGGGDDESKSSYFDLSDVIGKSAEVGPLRKRQSSTGKSWERERERETVRK